MKTLTKVKLINWHTFSNEEFEIYKNALITGENGTGKSTILDAIQYVLTAGKCKFNKAASDIGNRTLESYIRCKTGIEGHEFVRNGDVTTYIALEFYDEKTEKYQIIGTVIDLPAGGRLNRDFFQIIDCKISDVAFIEERRVLTRKEFKKALIDHQQTGIFKDTIKEGESLFGNALGVKSKYFDLVTRALAFKAIDNVYQFIVDFLLKEDFVDIQNLRDSIKHYKVLEEKLKISKKECESLGFDSVELTDTGIVYAYLNANTDKKMDRIGFIAHMDTATEITGANVKCRVISKYDGNTIQLNEEYSMCKEEFPALANCIGDDLIVTDGTTLLGADDKAGIAIILEAMEQLIQSEKEHGFIAVAFTPDEEVGRGVENFELDKFAVDYAFTIDGDRIDSVDYETFNAAQAVVTFDGTSIHPGDAKDRMVNASLLAMEYASSLPKKQTPSHTQGRQGFYHLVGMEGICEEAKLTYILRNHSKQSFIAQKQKMEAVKDKMNEKYGNRVHVTIRDQYENMRQYMHGDMRSVNKAKYALRQCDVTPVSTPIRGGTDGAMLTARGLICPNLGTGSFNHHGRFEFASIQKMEKMVEIVLKIVE